MNTTTPNLGGTPANTPAPALLDAKQSAILIGCSARHLTRLADVGKAPAPLKVGALTRWRRADLERWIADGCKPVRSTRGVR